MTVDEYILQETAKPFVFGQTDCATTADRWMRGIVGFSLLSHFGREIKNDADAKAWLQSPGGIAVGVNRVMRAAGMKKTKDPQKGDVGLIVHEGKLCVAIHAGTFWFSRHEGGFIGAPLAAVWKAWRIECPD